MIARGSIAVMSISDAPFTKPASAITDTDYTKIWASLREDAEVVAQTEPALSPFIRGCVLGHESFGAALCCVLSGELSGQHLEKAGLFDTFREAMTADTQIERAALSDLHAHVDRDPAAAEYLTPFLHFKGYHALQAYRMANWLWRQGRKDLARYIQGRCSREYDVDIHPGASIGSGIMIDHGSGMVIGETAVVEDDVSMLHGVTLGGTGKECGDRHPKIRRGVLLSAGARILGNIEVGEGAKVGASSLVLKAVEPHTTVAGVPAKVVGRPTGVAPALDMQQELD